MAAELKCCCQLGGQHSRQRQQPSPIRGVVPQRPPPPVKRSESRIYVLVTLQGPRVANSAVKCFATTTACCFRPPRSYLSQVESETGGCRAPGIFTANTVSYIRQSEACSQRAVRTVSAYCFSGHVQARSRRSDDVTVFCCLRHWFLLSFPQ